MVKIFSKKNNKVFSRVEWLILTGLLGIFLIASYLIVNPSGRFQDARNSRRWVDINIILTAIRLHRLDNGGIYLPSIEAMSVNVAKMIGKGNNCKAVCDGNETENECLDLSNLISSGHINILPVDPLSQSGYNQVRTGYYVVKSVDNSIYIASCGEEPGTSKTIQNISTSK